jgi:DNA-binding transcriptional LysR family regulator
MVTAVMERTSERFREALGLEMIPLPATLPSITLSQAWHPRFDADASHRWLRECLRRVCAEPRA